MDVKIYKTFIASLITYELIRLFPCDIIGRWIRRLYDKQKLKSKYPGYFYPSLTASGPKILHLFHGTQFDIIKLPIPDFDNAQIFTIDRDPNVKPTFVQDAVKDKIGVSNLQFDAIILNICQCCIWNQIIEVGPATYLRQLVDLLKHGGKLYICGFTSFANKTDDKVTIDIINDMQLRAHYCDDIGDCNRRYSDIYFYTFIKDDIKLPSTDKHDILHDREDCSPSQSYPFKVIRPVYTSKYPSTRFNSPKSQEFDASSPIQSETEPD